MKKILYPFLILLLYVIIGMDANAQCPTINAISTPANNAAYCSGSVIPAFNVTTSAKAPDSIKLVYFNSPQTDSLTIITGGTLLAKRAITGTAASNNTANFTNVSLPTLLGSVNDTMWIYAVYVDDAGTSTCKVFALKTVIVKPQPTASINGLHLVCNATPVSLTSGYATTYKWGKMPATATLSSTQTYAPTPTANTTQTYWLVVTNTGACASDTAYHTVTANGGIVGTAFRDFNSNGIINTNETYGFANIKVKVFDNSGALIDSALTDTDGRYSFPTATAGMGKLRVEFDKTSFPANVQESFSGTGNGTDIQFVTAPDCNVNIGLKQTSDFCGTNPKIVTPIFIDGASASNATGLNDALYSLNYVDYSAKTTEATRTETGSTWGVAYSKKTKQLFSAAFLKRHVGLKDGKLGQIYVTDMGTTGTPTTPWLDVSTLGLSGNWQYLLDAQRGLGNAGTPSIDSLAFSQIGQTGLGDIDISEDETQLYAMDLINKQLLVIDIATKTLVGAYTVPNLCTNPATPSYYTAYPFTFTSTDGKVWKNGYDFNTDNNGGGYVQNITNPNNVVAGTSDAALYANSIYSANGAGNFLNYQFSVGNGTFSVVLHLATNGLPNNTNFNVISEGSTVFSNVNVYAEAGNVINKAITKTFTATVTDGTLDIKLSGNAGTLVLISGFEIIPTSGQPSGQTRPFAIKPYKGKVYVGAVCDATGSQDMNDLNAGVFEFNPQTSTFNSTPILTFPLDYTKGPSVINPSTSPLRWYPWTNAYPNNTVSGIASNGFDVYNQPILSDIEFDLDGSMILGLLDRMGHQMGAAANYKPNGQGTNFGVVGGDLLRAYFNGSSYELENNAKEGASSTKSPTAGVNNNQGPGGGEFYFGDHLGGNANGAGTATGHYEILMGGLTLLPGSGEVRATVGDALVFSSGALASFNNTTGDKQNAFTIYTGTAGGVQLKSNGLGDLELLCSEPPLQIGNYVWFDGDSDGIQDPNESPLANIVVSLWKGGTQIASTTTDANGEYYFSSKAPLGALWTGTGADTTLLPNTAYEVRVNMTTYPSNILTLSNSALATANDQNDNDATLVSGYAVIPITTGDKGSINHTYDFGFSCIQPTVTYTYTQALTCTGITPSNNATLQITSVGSDKVAMSTTGIPTTLYSAATALVAGSHTFTAQNGLTDSFYVRVWNGATCFKDTLIVVKPKKCCPTINAITVPANNATYCGGATIPTFNVTTNAINPDSIRLVYFTSAQTDPYTIYNGPALDQKIISGTAASNTVSFTNVQLPSPFTGASDTIWIYAIYIDHTDDTSCKIFQSKSVILEPQQTQVIYGYDQICSGGSVTLTTNGAVTYQWGSVDPPSSALGTTQSINVTPTAPTTYWVKGNNTLYGCSSDTAFFTVTPGAGIYGTVYFDFNANGTQDANETGGISNITVRAYDSTGALIGTSTTNALGRYHISSATPAMGMLRVEFDKSTFPTGFNSSFVGSSNGSDVQFITATACNASLGLFQAGQYCENNPNMALVRFQRNNVTTATNMVAMMGYNTNAIPFVPTSGVDGSFNWGLPNNSSPLVTNYPIPTQTTVATYNDVGTTFGLGWDRKNKQLFTGAYMRAFSDMGANASANGFGEGIIYSIPINGGTVGASNVWLDLESLLGDSVAGVFIADAAHPGPGVYGRTGSNPNKIGYTGLGEIKVSDDGTQLYVVNLAVPEVLVIPIGPGGTAPTSASAIKRFPFPTTDIPAGNWSYGKPYMAALGLGVHPITGKVFATLTATGPTVNDLKGIVYSLDPNDATPSSGDFVKEIEIPMNFPRPATNVNVTQVYAMVNKPWEPVTANNSFYANVQTTHPWLGEVIFDLQPDGKYAMTIAERNRFHDQANGSFFVTGGVMYKVTTDGSNWILENNGVASPVSTSVNWTNTTANNAGTHTGINNRFYRSFGVEGSFSSGTLGHIPGSKEVITPAMDNVYYNGGSGIGWLSTVNGNRTKNSRLLSDGTVNGYNSNPFTKANNFGDIEPLCGEAPLQIGNYVWYDKDQDGVQDPNETPISNITVTLCKGGNVIATTTTNLKGEYYFSENSAANVNWTGTGADTSLLPNTAYEIKIDMSQSGIATPDYILTQTNSSGSNDQNDNDATVVSGNAVITLTTGAVGSINHTYDFGFSDLPTIVYGSLGNYVWNDLNGNGIQDEATAAGINGVMVYLLDNTSAVLDSMLTTNDGLNNPGYYLFDSLVSGTYYVKFPITNGGNNLTTAITTAQTDGNSDANIASGMSPAVVINTAGSGMDKDNMTIDAGYHACGSAGNYVWIDLNGNGLNDETASSGMNGVTVELWKETSPGSGIYTLLTSTVTANDLSNNPGYYHFKICDSANYKIKFPTTNGSNHLTTQTTTPGVDNNSDGNPTDGFSPVFTISPNGTGTAKDNPTLDAGYFKPACLGNYVWNDVNKDGIQNNPEVGVAGITVTLFDNANNVLASTITDAYGYYLFKPLNPGTYVVGFTLPANYVFTTTNSPSNDSLDSDVNTNTGFTGSYTLISGDSNMTVDAGIHFQRPTTASLGNYVWLDVNQDGIQNNGEEGISGVTVTLCNNLGAPIATMITNADGFYQFTELTPGTYTVGFTPPVGLTFSPNNGPISNSSNSDVNPLTGKTGSITVLPGDEITYVDAGLYSLPNNLGGLGDKVWYDLNQNGNQDPGEPGVEGIVVNLYQADGTTILSSTTTDAYGNYIFNNLPQGQYVVGFSNLPVGYTLTTTTGTDSTTNSDANTATGKTPVIQLAQGQFNLTYDAGIINTVPSNTNSLGNYVWYDTDKNGIQDPNELGVSGVTVKLYNNANTVLDMMSTDASGYYLFPDLTNGDYHVGFSNIPSGYVFSPKGQGSNLTDSDPDPSNGLTADVSLTGGTHNLNLDAGINLGNTKLGKATLGDLVWYDLNNNGLQDGNELGVQGVTATLYASNGTTVLATTTTNAIGNYIFTGLDAGSYIVGFSNLPSGFTVSPQDADTQGLNGELNSDVNVNTLQTGLIVLATGEDKMSIDMGITPPAGTASLGNLVWFDLNNDGLQTSGEPGVQGISVTLYDNANQPVATTTTNSDGAYNFIGLTPGTYYVGFDNLPNGYILTTLDANSLGVNDPVNSDADPISGLTNTVTLAPGDNNLNLDAGIKSNTVASVGDFVWFDINQDGIQDPAEPGIGGILVTLYDINNTPITSAITKPDGSYIFTNVTAGDYYIGFSDIPDGLEFTIQEAVNTSNTGSNANPVTGLTPVFTVTAGTHNPTIDAGLTIPAVSGLGNYVWYDVNQNGLQEPGEPAVPGVLATLFAGDGTTVLATAVTDGDGAYSFTNLEAGDYIVGFSNLPVGTTRTQTVGSLNDAANSDMLGDGKTNLITLSINEYNPNIDAGIYVGIPLPVVIKDFTAVENNCRVILNWSTKSESNTQYFGVMRKSSTDFRYKEIGRVQAAGNSQVVNNYSFVDLEVEDGIYDYQLKVVDLDGRSALTSIQRINVNCTGLNEILVYPNPVSDFVNILIHTETPDLYTIKISDMSGRTIMTTEADVVGSTKHVVMDMSSLANGVYQISVTSIVDNQVFKVLKSK